MESGTHYAKEQYLEEATNAYNDYRSRGDISSDTIKKHIKEVADSQSGNDYSVLDLGCGTGLYTVIWRNFTEGEIMGIDIADLMLEKAEKQSKEKGLNITYKQGDMFKELPSLLGNKRFNVITGLHCFSYVEGVEAMKDFFKELYNRLLPGGVLFFAVNNDIIPRICLNVRHLTGYYHYPKNGNIDRDRMETGEDLYFRICDPNNPENTLFEGYSTYYRVDVYLEALREAGFENVSAKPTIYEVDNPELVEFSKTNTHVGISAFKPNN